MTYQLQVQIDINRKRTPQKIINQIVANKEYFKKTNDQYYFEFNLIDFQHAIEILSDVDPKKPIPHLKPYIKHAKADLEELSSLSEYFYKFDHEDLKRNTMEGIGVGIASLFMNTSFKIDWRDMSHIPKEHFSIGKKKKKADFIGYSSGSRYYFEAKGSTSASYVKIGMEKAKNQLANIQYNAETKIALITYIPCDDIDFPPTLFLSDPPVDDGIDLDVNFVRMLHYQKILKYAGFLKTSAFYSKLVTEIIHYRQKYQDKISFDFRSMPIEKNLSKTFTEFQKESALMERRNINRSEFIGISNQYSSEDGVFTFFRGVDFNIIRHAIALEFKIAPLKDEIIADEGKASIFSDGTILFNDFIGKSGDRKKGLPEKPDPSISTFQNLFERSKWEPVTEAVKMRSNSRYVRSEPEKTKVPVLIRR